MSLDVTHRLQDQGVTVRRSAKACPKAARRVLCARYYAVLLLLLPIVNACNMVGERTKSYVSALTFVQYDSLPLDVGALEIRSNYDADAYKGNVDDLFPTTPENALRRYLRQRYSASRNYDTRLAMVVRDAHAKRKRAGKESNAMAFFGLNGRERYTVYIELALEHRTAEGQLIRRAVLNFRKGLIVPVRLSLAEREQRMNGFIQRFVRDIDVSVQNALSESLHILPANLRTTPDNRDKGLMPGMPLGSVASDPPEMRGEQDQYRQ